MSSSSVVACIVPTAANQSTKSHHSNTNKINQKITKTTKLFSYGFWIISCARELFCGCVCVRKCMFVDHKRHMMRCANVYDILRVWYVTRYVTLFVVRGKLSEGQTDIYYAKYFSCVRANPIKRIYNRKSNKDYFLIYIKSNSRVQVQQQKQNKPNKIIKIIEKMHIFLVFDTLRNFNVIFIAIGNKSIY